MEYYKEELFNNFETDSNAWEEEADYEDNDEFWDEECDRYY